MASLRSLLENCLDKHGTLSVRRDLLGVYGSDNQQHRSVLAQVDRIQHRPFVRIALVTISAPGAPSPPGSNLQGGLDNANAIYQNECDAWIYPVASIAGPVGLLGGNGLLDQDDCSGNGHDVSDEEDALFDLGRNLGANVVGYFIAGDVAGFAGCAAHPPGRRGFWVGTTEFPWAFAHELTHIIGDNPHPEDDPQVPDDDTDNLMWPRSSEMTNLPPDLRSVQCDRIHADSDVESC